MILFIVMPLLLILFQSIVEVDGDTYIFTINNIKRVFEPLYLRVICRSIKLAIISTCICLVLGYPVAAIVASWDLKHNSSMITWFIIRINYI